MPRLIACFGLLMLAHEPALAQTPICTSTPLPSYPIYGDNTSGWSAYDTPAQAQNKLAIGDIDGDGYDELVALNTLSDGTVRVEAWHWSYTTWTPMSAFPSQSVIDNNLPGGVPTQVHLADIDGGGRKEIVIYVTGPGNSLDQEQIYKYVGSGASNTNTNFTLITTVAAAKSDGRSYWFKTGPQSTQDARLRIGAGFLDIKQYENGAWVSLPGDGESNLGSGVIANCPNGKCVAFTDVDGDGLTDLVYITSNGAINYLVSSASRFFEGFNSTGISNSDVSATSPFLVSWQLGDIDGDGRDEMFFQPSFGQPISIYYFAGHQFQPYPGTSAISQASSHLAFWALRVLPKTSYQSSFQNIHGIASIATSGFIGSTLLQFNALGGNRSVLPPIGLENSFSQNGELAAQGYSSYLNFAVEQQGIVVLIRGSNGFLSKVETQSSFNTSTPYPFVTANTYTTNGYPAYPPAYQQYYSIISNIATSNANRDIRSLYKDPGQQFGTYAQTLLRYFPQQTPPVPINSLPPAEQAVYYQTLDELNDLSSVTSWYSETQTLLQDAYNEDDNAVSTVAAALNIPGQPDITSEALGLVTSILNGAGSAVGTVAAFLQVAKTTDEAGKIADEINAAGSFFYLLGNVTQDTSTYAAAPVPDLATGQYELRTILNNFSTGVLDANYCHEVATLSSWDQTKPLADGQATGLFTSADIADTEQVDKQVFQMTVWQTLAPSVWDIAPATQFFDEYLAYTGNPSTYPYSVPLGLCSPEITNVGMVFENVATNNFPSLTSLGAFFNPPPAGLGALSPALFDAGGWNFPVQQPFVGPLFPVPFDLNATLFVWGCSEIVSLSSGQTLQSAEQTLQGAPLARTLQGSAQAQLKNIALQVKPKATALATAASSPPNPTAILKALQQLKQQIPESLRDATLSARMSTDLGVASTRFESAMQFGRQPKDSVLLLNDAIARLQIHTQLSPPAPDWQAAQQALRQTIAIRNVLVGACQLGSPGCEVNTEE